MWVDVGGPMHYVDFGGPSDGPVIVCIHGLAGSAVDWSAIAPMLTGRCRVLAPDLAGHGLTRSGKRGTGVQANRILLDRFIGLVCDGPMILMGGSMGGMISLLEASAAADRVTGLILVDPALPFTPARPDLLVATVFVAGGTPGLGPALLRGVRMLPPATIVASMLSVCCANPSRVPAGVVAQQVDVARSRVSFAEAGPDLAVATRSLIATAGPGGHAYRAGIASLTCPVLLIHGERDRLVPAAAARAAARAHPSWSLAVLPEAGHLPQLEAPTECSAAILTWLDTAGQAAARAATPGQARGRAAANPAKAAAAQQALIGQTSVRHAHPEGLRTDRDGVDNDGQQRRQPPPGVQRRQADLGNAEPGIGRQGQRSAARLRTRRRRGHARPGPGEGLPQQSRGQH